MTAARTAICASVFLLITAHTPATAMAQRSGSAGPPTFDWIQVAPGVFATIEPRRLAYSSFVHGNSVFVVRDSDVVAFDANHTTAAANETIAQLRRVTAKPVRILVYSHFHGDHVLGAQAFVDAFPGLQIIATDSTRDDIERFDLPLGKRTPEEMEKLNATYDSLAHAGVDLAGRPLTPARRALWDDTRAAYRNYYTPDALARRIYLPTVTFSRELPLAGGKEPVALLCFGRGDTRGDAVMWLPSKRVLAAGDLLVEPVPYSGARFPSDWLRTLRSIRLLQPKAIIPGHGKVQGDLKYLDLVIATVDSTLRTVRRMMKASPGISEDLVVQRVSMDEFRRRFTHGDELVEDRWHDFIDGLVRGAYREVRDGM